MTFNAVKEAIMETIVKLTIGFIVFISFSTPVYGKTDTDVPFEVAQSAEYYGGMYGIDPQLITAICFTESSYNPYAENGPCLGIMQVNTDVHTDVMKNKCISDIYDINQNINCGTWVLYQYMQEDDDIAVVLMKYNGDKTGLSRYKETGEVSEYTEKILALQQRLETSMQTY